MQVSFAALAVFCGSTPGDDPVFRDRAHAFGATLARRGIRLIYGGGDVGLMGALADGVLSGGGDVHGVITRALEAKEIAHRGLGTLEVVETMHERKARMADLADGFVLLPGGFGSLDEFFEAVTWTQLGIHEKPCGVLDLAGYYLPLAAMIANGLERGFVRPQHASLVLVDEDPDKLLARMAAWKPISVDKWVDRRQR